MKQSKRAQLDNIARPSILTLLLFLAHAVLANSAELDSGSYNSIFGDKVMVFDPSMDMLTIQHSLDTLHQKQASNQFGSERYAILFKPGEYKLKVTVDYYVHAAGLGRVPGDVRINGTVQSISVTRNNNVTIMFWRAAENFLVVPDSPQTITHWAVSQAAPYRRMHIKGDVQFDRSGWASGGFLADSIIEGTAGLTSGQQWFTRNSKLGAWRGGSWNRTFVGTQGAPTVPWPEQPNTVVETTPVIREKPFLMVDKDGEFAVFVPDLAVNTRGVSWESGPEPGEMVPISEFHIAFPESDNAASINAALDSGKHILFTPGIYHLDSTIEVKRAQTILFGLGLPTLIPQSGKTALRVADVAGVKLVGLMFDAGPENSPALVEIGTGESMDHYAGDPITIHDLFCRVGGASPGRTEACLVINSNHVIVDHAWLWRADHGAGADWEINTCKNGLIVNGDDVTVYGLFNEHFQEYQTLWNGERGRTYFYQSEIPYDPPSQDRWMAGETVGYASYKVADTVKHHHAWGLGIYAFFGVRGDTDPGVRLQSSIECPDTPGVCFFHITNFAKGFGGINHAINELGPRTDVMELTFFKGSPHCSQ